MSEKNHIEIEQDHLLSCTVFRVHGWVSYEQVLRVSLPFFRRPSYNVLWDCRNGSFRQLHSVDLAFFARRGSQMLRGRAVGRLAFVVIDDVDFGIARMFISLGQSVKFSYQGSVFRDYDEAQSWLR